MKINATIKIPPGRTEGDQKCSSPPLSESFPRYCYTLPASCSYKLRDCIDFLLQVL